MPVTAEADILTNIVEYETIIGLEVHAQLLTKSKMYCSCSSDYAYAPPNTHVCPICLGMPGVLPTINRRAIEFTATTAIALNCEISSYSKFDRKNYTYPDLMKGYQVSQFDAPIGRDGWLMLNIDGKQKKIGITRVHLEEDVARLTHKTSSDGESYSLMDVNRAGVPLMEIVSEPDIGSPEEARLYLMKLRTILRYLEVSTGNMEEGSFRCDANISIRPTGTLKYLTKIEVKNMNSFKSVFRALDFEVKRQRKEVESGGKLTQETRGWIDDKGLTVSQRSKEYAHDYRYFTEPDLPPMIFNNEWVEELGKRLPELPNVKCDRFIKDYGLSVYDAELLVDNKTMAFYFEECLGFFENNAGRSNLFQKAKMISNWLLSDFSRLLNSTNITIKSSKITPKNLSDMLNYIDNGIIGGPAAKVVFEEMFVTGKKPDDIINEKGLIQISDNQEIEKIVIIVIEDNKQAVIDYKEGKKQSFGFLVGQVMKQCQGRANPNIVQKILLTKLGGY